MSPTEWHFVDEQGLYCSIIGWHQHNNVIRYLIQYTRPHLHDRCTHKLIDAHQIPKELLENFKHPEDLHLALDGNCGRWRIQLQSIIQVLDLAWHSDQSPSSSKTSIGTSNSEDSMRGTRVRFDDIFIRLQWRDHDERTHVTWESAETLMHLMDQDHWFSLLSQWASASELRHEQILLNKPKSDICEMLSPIGWQYR